MNVLFIGDYRPAANYGSIATTECLLDMIYPLLSDGDEMKIIDRRSYDRQTPTDGFHDKPVGLLRKVARKVIPRKVRMKIMGKDELVPDSIDGYRKMEHVPCLFRDFEYYSKEMLRGGGKRQL